MRSTKKKRTLFPWSTSHVCVLPSGALFHQSSFWREQNPTLTEWRHRFAVDHGQVPRGGGAPFRRGPRAAAAAAASEVLRSSPKPHSVGFSLLSEPLLFRRRHRWRRIAVELDGRIDARFRHRESRLLLNSFAEVPCSWNRKLISFWFGICRCVRQWDSLVAGVKKQDVEHSRVHGPGQVSTLIG